MNLKANSFTIDTDSVTGNYHGTLTIDSKSNVNFGFTDSLSQTTASVDLYALSEFPGELYWYGGANLHAPDGGVGSVMGGGGGGGFLLDHPTSNANNHDHQTFSTNSWDGFSPYYVSLTASFLFDFPISWDGQHLSGIGTWSIVWTDIKYSTTTHLPYVPVPDASSTIGLLLIALLALTFARWKWQRALARK